MLPLFLDSSMSTGSAEHKRICIITLRLIQLSFAFSNENKHNVIEYASAALLVSENLMWKVVTMNSYILRVLS